MIALDSEHHSIAETTARNPSGRSFSSVGLPEDRFVWAYAGNIGLAHGVMARR